MTLEKRIAAELYSYQGKMSVFVDDLQGRTVEIGADEAFETASTIKAFILAALYLQVSRGKASWTSASPTRRASLWTALVCCGRWAWVRRSR